MSDRDFLIDTYIRLYDRNQLAQYLAQLSRMSVAHETVLIRKVVAAQGHIGLIDMLRDMTAADPDDRYLRAALIAEERAFNTSLAMLRGWSAEIVNDIRDAGNFEVLRGARAA